MLSRSLGASETSPSAGSTPAPFTASGPPAAADPQWRRTGPSRRTFLQLAGLGAATAALAGCTSTGASGATQIRFFQNKPEVIGYFGELVEAYNSSQNRIRVTHDSSPTSLVAQIVRGAPPDLALYNYNLETSTYVARGVLSDLASLPETSRIRPDVQALVTQYATYQGQTNVLPYSITAAGVIYNKTIFADNGVEVPTTWPEMLAACQSFSDAGVTPVYSTYKDVWTLSQGLFDYSGGGSVDVAEFYKKLKNEGANILPDSPTTFENTFGGAVDRMLQVASFSNPDAPARAYADGNLAFGSGEAAMYMQGPWAFSEIEKVNPNLDLGTFPLPMKDDADNRVRVNLDLSLWIPQGSQNKSAARQFLSHLMQPDIQDAYNSDNLAYSPNNNPIAVTDPRIAELQPYVDEGLFYQGPNTYIPPTIPIGNYLQEAVISGDGTEFLRTLDSDWRRLAVRTS